MHVPSVPIKVVGEFALFALPDFPADPVASPVPTISGMTGLLESILGRPEMYWQIRAIEILHPIRYVSVTRNETTTKASWKTPHINTDAMSNPSGVTLRRYRLLKDPAYIVHAAPVAKDPTQQSKYMGWLHKRLDSGKCFQRPYFGCREFLADFMRPTGKEKPISADMYIGPLLFAVHGRDKGKATFEYFNASMKNGVVEVPAQLYEGQHAV